MKKKYVKLLVCICICVVTVLSAVLFISCSKNSTQYKQNISEARYNYFYGEAGGYKMSFTCGVRESDFKLDGYHTDTVEFGVLTVELPKDVEYSGSATFKLNYNNKVTSGKLEQNPFDLSLMADIGFIVQDVNSVDVSFTMGNNTTSITLNDVTSNFNYNYMSAYDIFIKHSENELKQFVVDNKFMAEVYIKIMHDNSIDSGYYYLVRVIGVKGTVLSAIINPITGEILAKTVSKL